MSRKAREPAELRAILVAARAVATEDDTVNMTELAKIIGIRDRTLKQVYVEPDPEFPILTVGSEGRGYQFHVVTVLDHMIRRCDEKINASRARNAQMAKMTGVTPARLQNGGSDLSILELSKSLDMTLKADNARNVQGERTDVEEASALYARLVSRLLNVIMGISHEIDPTNLLPVDIKTAIIAESRRMASAAKSECDEEIRVFRADIERRRNRIGNTAAR